MVNKAYQASSSKNQKLDKEITILYADIQCYKETIRRLEGELLDSRGKEFEMVKEKIYKEQKLRKPEEIEISQLNSEIFDFKGKIFDFERKYEKSQQELTKLKEENMDLKERLIHMRDLSLPNCEKLDNSLINVK